MQITKADIENELRRRARYKARTDLYFLLTEILGRKDMQREWLKKRCDEVQANPDEIGRAHV